MMAKLAEAPVDDRQIKMLIQELVRNALAQMLARQEVAFDPAESAAYMNRLDEQRARVVAAQRGRDWSLAKELGATTASQAGLHPDALVHPALARELLAQSRALIDLSLEVEREGSNPFTAARNILQEVGLKPERSALKSPMQLSAAIARACEDAPVESEKKIRAVGVLSNAYFGDVTMASLTRDQVCDFLKFVWNMPKNWGQLHGKNRFEQVGSGLTPHQIKDAADAADKALIEEVLLDSTRSVPEKRLCLVRELRARLADGYLYTQRDMFNRIYRAAMGSAATARDLDDEDRVVPSHRQLKRQLYKWHKESKTSCGLPTRVSRPKRRRSWSLEHLVKLFTSPLYAGTSSKAQRWRAARAGARHVIRDALYWVPLFMITLGVRPEEILQLKVPNVRLRDGVLCLFLGDDADEQLKNEQSRRILPVPQLLLNLGFREWIVEKARANEIWAFPEVEPSEADGRRSQIYGNRMRTYLGKIELKFEDEDIYAMRRTLSSKLLALCAETGVRQRILGHLEGSTVDRYYSDHGLPELKALLDQVDYGLQVGRACAASFPLITGCSAPILPSADLVIHMSDQGKICAIQVCDPDTDETVLAARVEGASTPHDDEAKTFEVMAAQDVANRLLALQDSHSLTLPASEVALAAFEHLLVLGVPPTLDSDPVPPKSSASTSESAAEVTASPNHAVAVGDDVLASSASTKVLEPGDTAICVFPLARRSDRNGQPRPGLVVGVKFMNGKRYIDVAIGAPAQPDAVLPHQVVVADDAGLASARIALATCFDLRRRILVAEDDRLRLHRRLGTLHERAKRRLREAMSLLGDVSPEPLLEPKTNRMVQVQVERRVVKKFTLKPASLSQG